MSISRKLWRALVALSAYRKHNLSLAVFCFVALPTFTQAQPSAKPPLSKHDVLQLLRGGVSSHRVAELARIRKVDFSLTPATESGLREAGADNEPIGALRDAAPAATSTATPSSASIPATTDGAGPAAQNGAGTSVLVDGDPPLTEATAENYIHLIPWVANTQLTALGRRQLTTAFVEKWKTASSEEKNEYIRVAQYYLKLMQSSPEQQAQARAKMQPVVLAGLRAVPQLSSPAAVATLAIPLTLHAYDSRPPDGVLAPDKDSLPATAVVAPSEEANGVAKEAAPMKLPDGMRDGVYVGLERAVYSLHIDPRFLVFYPDGWVMQYLPDQGLDGFSFQDYHRDPKNSNWVGHYKVYGNQVDIIWSNSPSDRESHELDEDGSDIKGRSYVSTCRRCSGTRFAGVYEWGGGTLQFLTDGTFLDRGAGAYMVFLGRHPMFGTGTYVVGNYSLTLNYSDGQRIRKSFVQAKNLDWIAIAQNVLHRPGYDPRP